MRSLSKRALLLAALSLPVAKPASAQLATVCVNCSTMWTQMLQYGKEAESVATQLQMKATQLQQYANQIQNTVALPMQVWGTAQSDLMQVRNLANAGSILSGNAGSIVSRLQAAGAYASMVTTMPTSFRNQFTSWQTTLGSNLNTFGRTLGLQQSQSASDVALLAAIQRHSQSAQGQMQALQAGNELASMTAQQLMQLRQTVAAQAQLQGGWIAVQAERQAAEDAALRQFLSAPQLAAQSNPRY